jgi:hypothetical protein
MAPTDPVFSMTKDAEGFDVAECVESPPVVVSSTAVTSMLSFDYYVYLNGTSDTETAQSVADELEPKIYFALAWEAMACEYLGVSFALIGLSSADADFVTGMCPDVTSEAGETCWKVSAKMTTTFFHLNGRRRHLIESEVVNDVILWMRSIFPSLANSDDDILKLDFQGFTALEDLYGVQLADTSQEGDNQAGTAGAQGGNIPLNDKNGNVGGISLVSIAAAGLIVVAFFIVTRRNKRQEAYLKHAEQVDEISLDEEDKASMAVKSGLVDIEREEEVSGYQEHFEGVEIEDANHDYRTCASARCQICQDTPLRPVFISTGKRQAMEVVASLSSPKNQRSSDSNDEKVEDIQML